MASFVHLSGYKFTALADLPPLKERLLGQCRSGGLCGTILLSTEGINYFVAGPAAEMETLLQTLRAVPGLEDLEPKRSLSAEAPYNRMLVKIKKEIIAFGIEGIDPARRSTNKVSARELKQWLDEGREVTLLDTRNDYEIHMGTFKGAIPVGIDNFRDFPDAVRKLPDSLKTRPLVMFCTGGIRCEKAGPYMAREGFENIFQLDGGILKYFEQCGGAHYEGECFVFDRRVGLDSSLQETNSVMCFHCQMPLTEAEQRHPHYVADIACPHCFGVEAGNRQPQSERHE